MNSNNFIKIAEVTSAVISHFISLQLFRGWCSTKKYLKSSINNLLAYFEGKPNTVVTNIMVYMLKATLKMKENIIL